MLLHPAMKVVQKITRKRFFGVVPKVDFSLPNEDSLDTQHCDNIGMSELHWDSQISLIAKTVQNSVDIKKMSTDVIGLN
jgi:cobyric acid synthase